MIGRLFRRLIITIFQLFNPKYRDAVLYALPRVYYNSRLNLGKKVHINDSIFINAVGGVSIGDYSVLSHGVTIISTKNDVSKWTQRDEAQDIHIDEKIVIGKNVWLCANVTVCSGVIIADNCIVAAGSVVTKSLIKPECLYGGIPAREIREI